MRPFENDAAIREAGEKKRAATVELQQLEDRFAGLAEKAAEADEAAIRVEAAESIGKATKKECQEAQDAAKAIRDEGNRLERQIARQKHIIDLYEQEVGKARVEAWKRIKADLEARHEPALIAFVGAVKEANEALAVLQEIESGFTNNGLDLPPYAVAKPGELAIQSHGNVHLTATAILGRAGHLLKKKAA